MGGSLHTVKKNAESSVAASEETGLEVTAYKTKYMVMSRDKNAGQSHSIKIDNSSLEEGGRVHVSGNNLNKSKFYSGTN